MAFLDEKRLKKLGLKKIGENVKISDKCSFYKPEGISIGDNTRVDDFCVLSAGEGEIAIGRNVHLSVYVAILGKGQVTLSDFTAISGHSIVYSSTDDYKGPFMSNPTVPEELTNVTSGPVFLDKHALVGAGTIILPNVSLGLGTRIGALSLVVPGEYQGGALYAGVPAKLKEELPELEKSLLEKEKRYLAR